MVDIETEQAAQKQAEDKPRRFVWVSDNQSHKQQTLSMLALAETILAVALIWGLSWYFDFYGWLLSSLLIAPLLLLRSTE